MTSKLTCSFVRLGAGCRSMLGFAAAFGCCTASLVADPPVFTNMTLLPGQQVQVQLVTEPGQSYTIEVSTNLTTWLAVGTLERVETNLVTLLDPEPVSANRCRFYRVKVGLAPVLEMHFMHQAEGGHFSAAFTPAVSYPVAIRSYSVVLEVQNDSPYPEPGTVRFTGPAGSGLTDTAAAEANTSAAWYQTPWLTSPNTAPAGQYFIQYKGSYHAFTAPDPQAAARQVVPVPTVAVVGGMLQSVHWAFRAPADGALLASRPAFITSVQVQVDGVGGRLYNSPEIEDPAVTSQTVSPSLGWGNVSGITMACNDTLGNHYITVFRKP